MFLEEVPTDVLPLLLPGVCVVVGGGSGDDDGLPWGEARVYRNLNVLSRINLFWG